MNTNKRQGNQFERELCEMLAEKGFWAHNFAQNKDGQPADIIAVKGRYHTLIDCKLISTSKGFEFSRWEENQRLSMRLFREKGTEVCFLALKLPDGEIRMLDTITIYGQESLDRSSIPLDKIRKYTMSFDEWLRIEFEANRRWKPSTQW